MASLILSHVLAFGVLLGNIVAAQAPNNGTNVEAYIDFPPQAWLGYGLDMTAVMPLDITAVCRTMESLSLLVLTS